MQKRELAILLGLLPMISLADSTWIGTGSVMSMYKGGVTNYNSADMAGINYDVSKLHSSDNVAFFQWLIDSNSCQRLKIYATKKNGDSEYYITPKATITTGIWSSRTKDRTIKDVVLPFIISKESLRYDKWFENGNWLVTSVEITDGTTSGRIYAECTNEIEDIQTDMPIGFGYKIKVDGGYVWKGNGSIMSAYFKSKYNDWASSNSERYSPSYGAFKDISKFYPNVDKQVVFFQWLRSNECSQLKIDIPNAPKNKKKVKLLSKKWDEDPSSLYKENIQLPYILENKDKNTWTVFGVYSNELFDKQYRVEASCCTAPDYNQHLWKIENPSCKQKWDMYSRFKYEKVLSGQREIIKAKINGTDTAHEIIKTAINLTEYALDPKGKRLSERGKNIAKLGIIGLFPNTDPDIADGLAGIISDVIIQSIEGTVSTPVLIEKKMTQILDIYNNLFFSLKLDNLTEEMYTSLVVTYYLEDYYAWGGDQKKVATQYGLSPNSSLETIIDAVANKHGSENHWYATDYYTDEAKEMIENIINNVIPSHTKECLAHGCKY
jgi:hypothetical protein